MMEQSGENFNSAGFNSATSTLSFREIRKRDGRVVPFDREKITDAIFKAARAVGGSDRGIAENLTKQVVRSLSQKVQSGIVPSVEEVQDEVEVALIENGHARTAKAYILYRDRRTRIRDGKSELMDVVKDILIDPSPETAPVSSSPSAKMMQIAMAASKQYYLSNLLPEDFARAHEEGQFHIHALEYYSKTLNCMQIDLANIMLQGFNNGYGFIRPPQRIASAAAQAAIILQSSQNDMFGGQSFPHFDRSMGEVIRQFRQTPGEDEVFQAVEGLIYNLNTMHSRAGGRAPLSTLNIGTDTTAEGRMVSKSLLEAVGKGLGHGETPLFPSLVFRIKKGVNFEPGDRNYDIYRRASEVAARRMNPAFSFMDSSFNNGYGDEVAYTGCRSRAITNRHGAEVTAGRGNVAAVTVNLPRLALESKGQEDFFFVQLDRLMRLASRQLLHRFEVLSRLRLKDLPFLMGQNIYRRSESFSGDDSIQDVIRQGTLAIGFIGLAETLTMLTGSHHGENSNSLDLGIKIVDHMSRRTESYADEYDLNFVLWGTPAGTISERFLIADRIIYGTIPGVTDRDYYSDSYHVPAHYAISFQEKIKAEGPFHALCNGGHGSYMALPAPPVDEPGLIDQIIRQMAEADFGYGEIIFPLNECSACSAYGVFHDKCPRCGSTAIRPIRKAGGYLTAD